MGNLPEIHLTTIEEMVKYLSELYMDQQAETPKKPVSTAEPLNTSTMSTPYSPQPNVMGEGEKVSPIIPKFESTTEVTTEASMDDKPNPNESQLDGAGHSIEDYCEDEDEEGIKIFPFIFECIAFVRRLLIWKLSRFLLRFVLITFENNFWIK